MDIHPQRTALLALSLFGRFGRDRNCASYKTNTTTPRGNQTNDSQRETSSRHLPKLQIFTARKSFRRSLPRMRQIPLITYNFFYPRVNFFTLIQNTITLTNFCEHLELFGLRNRSQLCDYSHSSLMTAPPVRRMIQQDRTALRKISLHPTLKTATIYRCHQLCHCRQGQLVD